MADNMDDLDEDESNGTGNKSPSISWSQPIPKRRRADPIVIDDNEDGEGPSTSSVCYTQGEEVVIDDEEEEEMEEEIDGYTPRQYAALAPVNGVNLLCSLCERLFIEPQTTVCGHSFCMLCFLSATAEDTACPTCRTPFDQTSLHVFTDGELNQLTMEIHSKRQKILSDFFFTPIVRGRFQSPDDVIFCRKPLFIKELFDELIWFRKNPECGRQLKRTYGFIFMREIVRRLKKQVNENVKKVHQFEVEMERMVREGNICDERLMADFWDQIPKRREPDHLQHQYSNRPRSTVFPDGLRRERMELIPVPPYPPRHRSIDNDADDDGKRPYPPYREGIHQYQSEMRKSSTVPDDRKIKYAWKMPVCGDEKKTTKKVGGRILRRSKSNDDLTDGKRHTKILPQVRRPKKRTIGRSSYPLFTMEYLNERINVLIEKQESAMLQLFEKTRDHYLKGSLLERGECIYESDDGQQALTEAGGEVESAARYLSLERLTEFNYVTTPAASHVVTCIEFDYTRRLLAIGGTAKNIRIFDFNDLLSNSNEETNPCCIVEIANTSKISNLSWHSSDDRMIACADYDGFVFLHDVSTNTVVRKYREHNRRVWDVHFARHDPKFIASVGDDGKIFVWTTLTDRSTHRIDINMAVTGVEWSPHNEHVLACSAADQSVYVYDIRFPRDKLARLRGHGKSCSYAKFMDTGYRLVSAATDSTLRIWNTKTWKCEKILTGHVNDRNFIGLTTCGDFVACGSEDNQVYVYNSSFSSPMMVKSIQDDPIFNSSREEHDYVSDFVSAVAWRKESNLMVSGNSEGIVQIYRAN